MNAVGLILCPRCADCGELFAPRWFASQVCPYCRLLRETRPPQSPAGSEASG